MKYLLIEEARLFSSTVFGTCYPQPDPAMTQFANNKPIETTATSSSIPSTIDPSAPFLQSTPLLSALACSSLPPVEHRRTLFVLL